MDFFFFWQNCRRPELCSFPPRRVIQKIIELKPKSKYIVAVDDAKNTLEEVVKVILSDV